jgi:hypothetical protein
MAIQSPIKALTLAVAMLMSGTILTGPAYSASKSNNSGMTEPKPKASTTTTARVIRDHRGKGRPPRTHTAGGWGNMGGTVRDHRTPKQPTAQPCVPIDLQLPGVNRC